MQSGAAVTVDGGLVAPGPTREVEARKSGRLEGRDQVASSTDNENMCVVHLKAEEPCFDHFGARGVVPEHPDVARDDGMDGRERNVHMRMMWRS